MSSTTADRDPVIHLAIELSCSTWLVAARLPGDEKPRLHRLGGGDTAALLALISSLRARVAARLGAPIGVVCCFEADGTASGVRPEGAYHLWRKVPSRQLSIDLEADERLGWVTGRVEAS